MEMLFGQATPSLQASPLGNNHQEKYNTINQQTNI